ncbi:hypothetical protein ACIRBX_27580 [Kitasatospora sp. NPDC096147]|uniref:hypothetical protein n=1 Tax=Kitasatospora sp. NPDC096147 TaxID=3364093 RepID=UPI0038096095
MRRPVLPALAVAALLLTTAACGSRPAPGTGGTAAPAPAQSQAPSSPSASPSASAAAQDAAAQRLKDAVAAHDAKFPEVARRCAAAADTVPAPKASGTMGGGPAENPKYAENHAFKSTVPLTEKARCRGEGHAARLAAAALPKDGAAAGAASVLATLDSLGYPKENVELRVDTAPGLAAVLVPGVGPCVTVRFGPKPTTEVHGVYQEGGCVEPRGGH